MDLAMATLYAHVKIYCEKRTKSGARRGYCWCRCTGISTAPHLHYEVRKDNKKINPVNFI